MEREITREEYIKMVKSIIPKYPVLTMLDKQNIPIEKWASNIHRLIDEKLGITRREAMFIEGIDSHAHVQCTEQEVLKIAGDAWEASLRWHWENAYGKVTNRYPDKETYLKSITKKQ